MAFTLKTSGLATHLRFCVGVDEDGTTIKEFVSSTVNSTMTLTGVTLGTGSWKSTTRKYFVTSADSATSSSAYFGPKFVTNFPSISPGDAAGATVFMVLHQHSHSGTNQAGLMDCGYQWELDSSSKPQWLAAAPGSALAASTKCSFGNSGHGFATDSSYFGLESGSLTLNGTSANGGYGNGSADVLGFGGYTAKDPSLVEPYLVLGFDKILSEAEAQSIHNDPWGTLFDASGGGGAGISVTLSLTDAPDTVVATASMTAGTLTIPLVGTGNTPRLSKTVDLSVLRLSDHSHQMLLGKVSDASTGVITASGASLTPGALYLVSPVDPAAASPGADCGARVYLAS